MTDDDGVWDYITRYACNASNHNVRADASELMDGAQTAQEYKIADFDEAPQGRIIRKGHVLADDAIMPDVRTNHKKALVADGRCTAPFRGRDIHRDMLADVTVSADHERRVLTLVVDRLRRATERGKWCDLRARPNCCAPGDMHVSNQLAAVFDFDFRPDYAIRADLDVFADFCAALYPRSRIDGAHSGFTGRSSSR